MLDEPQETGGKINWPLALGLSLAGHVVALGLFWMIARPSEDPAAEDGTEKSPPAAAAAAADAQPGQAADVPAPPTPPTPPVTPPSTPPAPRQVSSTATRSATVTPPPGNTAASADEAGETYVVKPGDGLSRIAKACGCTQDDLIRLNGAKARRLQPGQQLKVPKR